MAQETSKATERRLQNVGKWGAIIRGEVLDVGPGDDLLVWPGATVTPFDQAQGDANKLLDYFKPESFDTIHGSQVMEHLHDPARFIRHCLQIVRPGGWIVMTVPDWDLYEKRRWPSVDNPDHKTSWSLWRGAWEVKGHTHIHVPSWLKQNWPGIFADATLIDTNYDYMAPPDKDQTWIREDGVECWIEILIRRPQ